ncbi:MAG TPA: LysR family transcriptional regulator, partial [Lachnospiraceae bacterium]|nr:LysR family transcriptional regulator [Lachnospiraceae bacterium]
SIHDEEQLRAMVSDHNRAILNSFVNIYIEKEKIFFDSRAKLLLYLIGITNSVRQACDQMALSYGKAWNILNELEENLEYAIVERKQGGSRGGNTRLTQKGLAFISAYQEFEENVIDYSHKEFERLFEKQSLL